MANTPIFTGRPIIVYKWRSRGEILGEYNCYTQFMKLEEPYETSYLCARNGIIDNLAGRSKSYTSKHFRSRVAIKFKQ